MNPDQPVQGQGIFPDPPENNKEVQAYIFSQESRKVRNTMFWIAVVLLASDLLALSVTNLLTTTTLLYSLLFPVVYVGLGFLALKEPRVANIIGILVFIGILVLGFIVYGSHALIKGALVKILVLYFLFAGFQSARTAEIAKKQLF